MRHTGWAVAIYTLSLLVAGETRLDVSQFTSLITCDLAVDRNDHRMARSLKSIRLTNRLTSETSALLAQLGIGPETVRELQALSKQSAKLPAPALEPLATVPLPSASQEREVVAAMRQYVSNYLAHFPDFIATKDMRNFRNYKSFNKPDFYMSGNDGYRSDTDTFTTAEDRWYEAGHSSTETAYVAGRTLHPQAASEKHSGVSHGEYGGMMEEIFDPARAATFKWDRWQVMDGTRLAVIAYAVPLESSHYAVCCRNAAPAGLKPRLEYVRAGHRGFVFVDPHSGTVMRLILYSADFSEPGDRMGAGQVLDYAEVSIDSKSFLLPSRSTAFVRIGAYESREEITYRNYRKFTSDAAINFTGDAGPEPKH